MIPCFNVPYNFKDLSKAVFGSGYRSSQNRTFIKDCALALGSLYKECPLGLLSGLSFFSYVAEASRLTALVFVMG